MALSIQAGACRAVLLLLLTLFALPHSVHGHQTTDSADLHPIQLEMMPFVEDMLEHAINGYLSYAFPKDTLASLTGGIAKPIKSVPLFKVHATLIDMLDTVAVMGRPELFRRLAQWVERHVDFSKGVNVSAHELNTRIIGGLIGAHYMYEEGIVEVVPEEHDYQGGLLKLAVDLADRIMLLFDTPTGIPYGSVHLRLNRIYNRTLYAECRESGGYLMEFAALSKATGNPKYETAARRAAQALFDLRVNTTSAIPTAVNISTGAWATEYVSLGKGGIITLEHALKEHALGGEPGDWYRFEVIRRANSRNLLLGGLYNELHDSKRPLTRSALHRVWATGYPAMLAMAGHIAEAAENALSSQSIYRHLGSLPAKMKLNDKHESVEEFEDMLHPDHIKSLYSLYRTTKDPVYLTMGKEVAMIIHTRSRTVAGFASLSTMSTPSHRGRMSDTMDSFLLSENLKYLFLLFDECNVLHLQGSGVHPSCAELVEDARTSGSSPHTRVGWLLSPGGHPMPNHAGWWNAEAFVSLANNQRSFAAGEVTGEVSGLDTVRGDIPLTAHALPLVPGLQTLESAREERIRFRTEPLHRRRQRHLYSMLRSVIAEKIARGEAMMHLEVSKIQGSKKPPIRGSQNLAMYLREVESAVPSEYTCRHLPANEVMHCGHTIQIGVSPLDY